MRFLLFLVLLIAVLVPGCPKSSDGDDLALTSFLSPVVEFEPNNSTLTASPVSSSGAGSGALTSAGDVDFWSVGAEAGTVIQVEMYAVRLDHAAWISAAAIPEMRLVAPDGTTELLRTQEDEFYWGNHDLDLVSFRVVTTGTHFIRVSTNTGLAGGKYAIAVRTLSYPAFQSETETNDTFAAANPIVPGVVYAHHTDNEDDFYSFAVTVPTIVHFEMQAHRNAMFNNDDDYFDTEIELLDTNGTTVLLNNDDTYFYDSSIRFLLSTPGTYFLRVTECCGAGDADYFLVFSTTTVGSTVETEPNDTEATGNTIAYGTIISADHAADDDFFRFSGAAGDMVRVFVFDLDNIQTASADLAYALIAPDGFTVVPSDYDDDDAQVLRAILPATGTYCIRVTGPAATTYALNLELFARTTFETETNNSQFTAGSFNSTGFASGVVDTDTDLDFFKVEAKAGELVTILVYADQPGSGDDSDGFFDFSGWGSTLQPRLRIMNGAGSFIADARTSLAAADPTTESIINGLATAQVSFIAPTAGTYYVVVSAENVPVSSSHIYALQKK